MLDRFGAESAWTDIEGPVHFADFGGEGRPIVLVHGLGGSHTNWLAIGEHLTRHGRIVAPDLSGHGRTPPHRHGTSVEAHRLLLDAFLGKVAGGPAVLVGNSMGGALSILQAAANPESVAGLVLIDPALPRAPGSGFDPTVLLKFVTYALPAVGEAYVASRAKRLGPEGLVEETMRLCTVDPSRVPSEVIDAGVALRRDRMDMPWAHESFLRSSRTLMKTLLNRTEFERRVLSITAPGLVIHGIEDRLVALGNVERLEEIRPDWRFEYLEDIGHVPQLEAPDRVVELIDGWMATLPPSPTGDSASA